MKTMPDFKSLLPEYNPDPVFIFLNDGKCYFKNKPATRIFKNLENFTTLTQEIDIKNLIEKSQQRSITYQLEEKYYRIKIVGVKDENIMLAYSQEITELIKSMQKEQEAMRIKDDFFRNISHEMKTPLNAIIGLLPLIKKSIQGESKLLKLFSTVDESSRTLHKLIEKLLDVQKIQEGSFNIENEHFELLPLLDATFTKYEKLAKEKQQKFRVAIDSQNIPYKIQSDADKIIQILTSLLDNAIKFTKNGGIVASKISYDKRVNLLQITVKDNGIGISQEHQKKIFEAQQVDASMTREFEGSGLELFIVSNIVQTLQGSIELTSELGKGSLFTITIPCTT